MEKELSKIPGEKSNQEKNIAECEADIAYYTKWKLANPVPEDNKTKKDISEKRKQLRDYIHSSLTEYVFEPKEKALMTYRGFDIILPANMTREKPYVWLKRNGRYYVELGDTNTGNLIRIDNFLDDLQTHLDKLNKGFAKLQERERQLKDELRKEESFSDEIEKCRKKLEKLDKELGVDKK